MLQLRVCFLTIGWQWPFRTGDVLRVHQGPNLICELSEEILRSIILHYVAGHELTQRVGATIQAPMRRPLVKMLPAAYAASQRLVLRDRRKSRKDSR